MLFNLSSQWLEEKTEFYKRNVWDLCLCLEFCCSLTGPPASGAVGLFGSVSAATCCYNSTDTVSPLSVVASVSVTITPYHCSVPVYYCDCWPYWPLCCHFLISVFFTPWSSLLTQPPVSVVPVDDSQLKKKTSLEKKNNDCLALLNCKYIQTEMHLYQYREWPIW